MAIGVAIIGSGIFARDEHLVSASQQVISASQLIVNSQQSRPALTSP
jgi:hypothetical protein